MWKCPNCETVNEGRVCVICGEAMPVYKPKVIEPRRIDNEMIIKDELKTPSLTYKKRKGSKTRTALYIVIITICLLILSAIALIVMQQAIYNDALSLKNNGEYESAIKKCELISRFNPNAEELIKEAKYSLADEYQNNQQFDEALKTLHGIESYADAGILEQYIEAKKGYYNGEYLYALKISSKMPPFRDISEITRQLTENAYNTGVNLYHSSDHSSACDYFEFLSQSNYKDAKKYYTLCMAHLKGSSAVSLSELYSLLGFEDAGLLVLDDSYILDYLEGKWSSRNGDTLEFNKSGTDGTIWCTTNLPFDTGKWSIRDRTHYVAVAGNDIQQGIYEAVSQNQIKLYCTKNGRTYVLYRR